MYKFFNFFYIGSSFTFFTVYIPRRIIFQNIYCGHPFKVYISDVAPVMLFPLTLNCLYLIVDKYVTHLKTHKDKNGLFKNIYKLFKKWVLRVEKNISLENY